MVIRDLMGDTNLPKNPKLEEKRVRILVTWMLKLGMLRIAKSLRKMSQSGGWKKPDHCVAVEAENVVYGRGLPID